MILLQLNSLLPPFGTCHNENTVPGTECKKNCKTLKMVAACQCRDFYMNDLPEGEKLIDLWRWSLMSTFCVCSTGI